MSFIYQLTGNLKTASDRQQSIAEDAQGRINAMVELSKDGSGKGNDREVSSTDLNDLALRLKSLLDRFEFNRLIGMLRNLLKNNINQILVAIIKLIASVALSLSDENEVPRN